MKKKSAFKALGHVMLCSLKENPKGLLLELACGMIEGFQSLPQAVFFFFFINAALGQQQPGKALVLAGVFAFVMFLLYYIASFIGTLQGWYMVRLPHIFQRKLVKKSLLLDFRDVDNADRINQYVHALEMTFRFCDTPSKLIRTGLTSMIELAVLASLLSTLDGIVAAALVVYAVGVYFLNRKVAAISKKKEDEKVLARRKADYAQELMFSGEFAKDSRAYGANSMVRNKFRQAADEVVEIEKRGQKTLFGWEALQEAISAGQNLFLYLFMIVKYAAGAISIGSFTMYVSAANSLYRSVSRLLQMYASAMDFPMYFRDYQDYMELSEEMRQTARQGLHIEPDHCPTIEFCNVSFRYPSRSEYALRNVNLTIPPCGSVAVVGENGAGKSTFVKLLLRLYDVTEGEILVDGHDIREYPYDEYMRLFSTVFQDFIIFIYSVKENIGFDRAEKEYLEAAMKKAGVYQCIERLPKKEKTILGKRYDSEGVDLSGGEKQKVAIARAFYKDASVAVLDEPTAALDPLAEYEVYHNFQKFAADKTAIYISHRMSSSRFCDQILVFSEGQVAESGTHAELMEKKGIYYNMYEKQSSYYSS